MSAEIRYESQWKYTYNQINNMLVVIKGIVFYRFEILSQTV